MNKETGNIFSALPEDTGKEVFESLIESSSVSIERIISQGHTSPDEGWYDQDRHEWVIVLEGAGKIEFEDGRISTLSKGDYLNIPSHTKHKVIWTDPTQKTIWLAIHYC